MKKSDHKYPPGYSEQAGGLCGTDSRGNSYNITTTPLRVVSLVRSARGDNWSLEIEVGDSDGKLRRLTVPARDAVGGGSGILKTLVDHGLRILPNAEKDVLAYLQRCEPDARKINESTTGWLDEQDVFITPTAVIGHTGPEEIVLVPPEESATYQAIHPQGTLEQWKTHVAEKARGNDLLLFSIMVALTGPLQKLLRLDGGGFHYCGPSSRGKTTCLQVAASVWGDGSDPGSPGKKPLVCRWNMTANGVEGIAATHSDMVTCLDELGTFTGKGFGSLLYNLTSGQGKATLKSNRKMQNIRRSRTNVLSCGEVSIEAKIRSGGERAMTGQLLRIIDIQIANNIVVNSHGMPDGEFVVSVKKASSNHYGTAGPALVEGLVDAMREDREYVLEVLYEGLEQYAADLAPVDGPPEQGRVMRRLAAVRVAGELAVQFGILPVSNEEVEKAVLTIRNLWLQAQHTIADVDRAVRSLQAFIVRNSSAFAGVQDDNARISNCRGFWNPNRDAFLFDDSMLEAAANGYEPKLLARELRERGLLCLEEGGRLKVGQKVAALKGKRLRLYAVRAAIVEANLCDEEQIAVSSVAGQDDEF